ncbi:MAG: hypothetical protein SVV80_07790 [Planctomycetota bacterium]|nr:hypothetical protein [Planctomycetota bacterium]
MVFTGQENNNGQFTPRRTGSSIIGFALFTAAGMFTLACATLLPEYAVLSDLQARRDAVAHQIRCDEKLAEYNERMIHATRDDPVLIARLMIRQSNYRPAGCETVEAKALQSEPSVPKRILEEARNPQQREGPPSLTVRAGFWLADTTTGGCMILLGLAMLTTGVVLFPPGALQRADQRSVITHFR